MATTDQLCDGLVASFEAEAGAVLADLEGLIAGAAKEHKAVSPKGATTLHGRLERLSERAAGYAAMLGVRRLTALRTRLISASNEIQSHMSGIEIRFGLIFDELARDAG